MINMKIVCNIILGCCITLLFLSCNKDTVNIEVGIMPFPNPCTDQVLLSYTAQNPLSGTLILEVKDGNDDIIFRDPAFSSQTFVTIDMSTHPEGIYYIELYQQSELISIDQFLKLSE